MIEPSAGRTTGLSELAQVRQLCSRYSPARFNTRAMPVIATESHIAPVYGQKADADSPVVRPAELDH